jgi:hypothetical protein
MIWNDAGRLPSSLRSGRQLGAAEKGHMNRNLVSRNPRRRLHMYARWLCTNLRGLLGYVFRSDPICDIRSLIPGMAEWLIG